MSIDIKTSRLVRDWWTISGEDFNRRTVQSLKWTKHGNSLEQIRTLQWNVQMKVDVKRGDVK